MINAFLLALSALTVTPRDSTCRLTTDSLIVKVARNYPGVTREITTPAARAKYDNALNTARAQADRANGDECFGALRAVTDSWHDAHLFIYQSAAIDANETARRVAAAERRPVALDAWRARWNSKASIDPIEGLWYEQGGLEVAIVPDSSPGQFVAVVVTPDSSTWQAGMVRARITRHSATTSARAYDVEMFSRDHSRRLLDGNVVRDVLLRMPPVMWGKREPVAKGVFALDRTNPRAPTLHWLDSVTAVIGMPSMDGSYGAAIEALVNGAKDRFAHLQNLIIDVRGNEGGGAQTAYALVPYVVAPKNVPERPFRVAEWRPLILATPENLSYVRRTIPNKADTSASNLARLHRMLNAAPGTAVRYLTDDELTPHSRETDVYDLPKHVAILADHLVVSAAEALILECLRSPRVTLFGENTGGVLDYGSTSVVGIRPGERRWYLGYPTIIANDSVPARGIRGRGIKPDVTIDVLRSDAVQQVWKKMQR